MDSLLNPNPGLMIWTIVTFIVLVVILRFTAWKQILSGLAARESKIKNDIDSATRSREEAAALKSQFETQLAEAQKTIQKMVSDSKAEAEKSKAQLISAARDEAEKLLEKGRRDLAGEADRLKGDLKKEVAGLAMSVAEKALGKSVDSKIQESVLQDSMKEIVEVKR